MFPRTSIWSFSLCSVKIGPIPIAIVGWATSLNTGQEVRDAGLVVKPYALAFPLKSLFGNINKIGPYLSPTVPTTLSIAIGTIQCVESAKRAEDFYPTRESMFADGIGTIIASIFGSFLGMTSK